MYKYTCKVCKKENISVSKNRILCSRKCYSKHRSNTYFGKNHSRWIDGRSNERKICPICKKVFFSSHIQFLCSRKCKFVHMKVNKINSGKNSGTWKGGIIISKYILLYKPKHLNSNKIGYIAEHRYNMSLKIGRKLEKYEVVHHVNENKHDNRIENLQLMTKIEHDRFHTVKRHLKENIFGKKHVILV